MLGGSLLVFPDGLFISTSGVWQGSVVPATFVFTAEGAFSGVQLAVPPSASGAVLRLQGATFDPSTFTLNSTNAAAVHLVM